MIVRGAPIACARNRIPNASSTARKQRMPYGDGKHKRSRPVWQTRAAPYLNAFFRNGRQVSRGRRTFPTRSRQGTFRNPNVSFSAWTGSAHAPPIGTSRINVRNSPIPPRVPPTGTGKDARRRVRCPEFAGSTHGRGEKRRERIRYWRPFPFRPRARGKTGRGIR